jgi:trimeric autotransporter adhesin
MGKTRQTGDLTSDNNIFADIVNDRVGVGITQPTQKLHVSGSVRITGGIYDGNNSVGTAGSVLSSTGSGLNWIAGGGGGAFAYDNTSNIYSCSITSLTGRTSGAHNFLVGTCAGKCITSGCRNNFLGCYAGRNNQTGNNNNFFGDFSGSNNTGSNNNFMGYFSGYSNTTGRYNNFFGENAGYCNTTQSNSIAIGKEAGYWNQGANNIYLGECAGRSASREANILELITLLLDNVLVLILLLEVIITFLVLV